MPRSCCSNLKSYYDIYPTIQFESVYLHPLQSTCQTLHDTLHRVINVDGPPSEMAPISWPGPNETLLSVRKQLNSGPIASASHFSERSASLFCQRFKACYASSVFPSPVPLEQPHDVHVAKDLLFDESILNSSEFAYKACVRAVIFELYFRDSTLF